MSINQIAGGKAVNQVADCAEAMLDLRFIDDKSFNRLHKRMSNVADRYGVSLETVRLIKVSSTNVNHPLVVPFIRLAEAACGRPMERVRSLGISDAHFFAEHGVPVILSRPQGGGSHAAGEWIDAEDLDRYYRVVKAYVQEVAIQA